MDISIDSVLGFVRDELDKFDRFGVFLFWLRANAGRDEVCAEIARATNNDPDVIVVVLRKRLFTDPNSWAMDVADLLDDVKDLVWQGEGRILSDRPIAIVVVAQTSLLVAQASSPARLPDWFPKYGGNEVTAFARDVVANAGARSEEHT